ncbi:hypothetical protein A0H81_00282 [Grifola frondosa]|uniref:Stress-response A/B barrel domain-containing protein n=1 Tax=Grifola frondosa TaxID=5627 RepID=A0A1C7MQU7_GRIFR|nr:hypothetical protein A0H81_00282 [Grifola frondosa]
MSVLHVALAKIDQSALRQTKEEAFEEIRKIIATIPVAKRDVRVGSPLNASTTRGYDIALTMIFDDYDTFRAYLAHPKHLELLKRFGPALREMISYQIDGPGTKAKL